MPKNYLGLAEKAGAKVFPEHTVTKVEQLSDGSWVITARKSSAWFGGKRRFSASQVVMAAGTYNTQKLLHKMKATDVLPKISDQLGKLSRTNSEALTGSIMPKGGTDFSKGSAITSSFFPDDHTHVEPVRYGKGSNFMGLLQTVMTDGTNIKDRRKQWLRQVITKRAPQTPAAYPAERSISPSKSTKTRPIAMTITAAAWVSKLARFPGVKNTEL